MCEHKAALRRMRAGGASGGGRMPCSATAALHLPLDGRAAAATCCLLSIRGKRALPLTMKSMARQRLLISDIHSASDQGRAGSASGGSTNPGREGGRGRRVPAAAVRSCAMLAGWRTGHLAAEVLALGLGGVVICGGTRVAGGGSF